MGKGRAVTIVLDVAEMRELTALAPERAVVLCVDEKSQVQALDRTQPLLPMGPGRSSGARTTTSGTEQPRCSRRDVKVGSIIGKCMARYRASEFRKFLDDQAFTGQAL